MFGNLNPFQGVSWNKPFGDAGQGLWDAATTGKGTPWGAGNQKGYSGHPVTPFSPLESNINIASGGTDAFIKGMSTGEYTPWGPTGKRGFSGTAPGNLLNLFPGAMEFQQSFDRGLFDEAPQEFKAEEAKGFNPDEYAASDYADVTRAGQEEVARNLSRRQNDILGAQQKAGGIGSAQTGFNLADALSGAAQGRQNVASRVGQLQYGDKLGQYQNYLGGVNARNQAGYNKYASAANQYGQDKETLGKAVGALGLFL